MKTVRIDDLADAVNSSLNEYKTVSVENVKKAVRSASETVKDKIQDKAPVDTGAYRKSFTITKQEETADSLINVVHSKNRYQLTHLLEHGHAKRNGGRTKALVHIAPAEKAGIDRLISEVEKGLKG